MKIKVEQEHIDNGVKNSPGACAVALAMKSVKEVFAPVVRRGYVVFYDTDKRGIFKADLPDEAKRFINQFDNSKNKKGNEPMEFEIEPVRKEDYVAPEDRN